MQLKSLLCKEEDIYEHDQEMSTVLSGPKIIYSALVQNGKLSCGQISSKLERRAPGPLDERGEEPSVLLSAHVSTFSDSEGIH